MPKKPQIHIQNIAPGPPIAIAPATPAKFPVPTVAAKAVNNASYDDVLFASLLNIGPKKERIALGNNLN